MAAADALPRRPRAIRKGGPVQKYRPAPQNLSDQRLRQSRRVFFPCAYCPFRAASIYRLIAATSLYFSTASPFWTTRVGAWLIP